MDFVIKHAEIHSASMKAVEKLGTVVELKLHFRESMQERGLLENMGSQIGQGPDFIVEFKKHQPELGDKF